ncbi:20142_t:CDS:2, partial [Gigaspora rosea]
KIKNFTKQTSNPLSTPPTNSAIKSTTSKVSHYKTMRHLQWTPIMAMTLPKIRTLQQRNTLGKKRTPTSTDSTSMTILEEKCNSYTDSNDEITPGDSNNEPYTRRKER